MFRVGLTGNIASGKSSVARLWKRLGAAVVDADVLARRAIEPGSPGLAKVVDAFGEHVLDARGRLDRARLRRIVFDDARARARLEAIVHPEVARLRDEEDARLERAGARIVVHDVPLLFEAGLADEFDLVVLVDAPEDERRRRLVEDRGLHEDEARRMMNAQLPAALKRAGADILLENDQTLAALEARAEAVWKEIEGRLKSPA